MAKRRASPAVTCVAFPGQDIDADHIAATYQNGVLTVTLPVAARAEPRRIEISHGAREETKIVAPSDSSDQHTTT